MLIGINTVRSNFRMLPFLHKVLVLFTVTSLQLSQPNQNLKFAISGNVI